METAMLGNPEAIRLNIRYYQRLLMGDRTTYSLDEALKLLEAAIARLAEFEAEGSNPGT
jgi:hypothetical protein